ncbi:hypothetical protein DIPPA_08733 [Diplonema papillatum]|nr:hypothetical protein DIPPA_08733 [Diplonema papillatum]
MSPVTVPASPIPMVSIEGEPHVGERLRCQHNLSAESQVSWYISDDGWHFTFLRNGLTIRPTADQVHQYLQVEVESNGELHRSRLVFINVSAETDDALRQLIARCTVGRTPAEFSVVVDGSPGLLLLALSPMHVDEDGSIHVIEGQFGSSVVLVLEDGTATVVCEARVADCEWICSSSRSALLTAPGMAAAAMLESPTKTERDGLVLCARLFTALPASLLDYLRTLGSEEAILEEFTKQDSLSSQSNPIAGATPTLLMRTELMQRK